MKRFSIVNSGYNIDEVNEFIEVVIKRLEKLNEENNYYLKLVNDLKKQVSTKEEPSSPSPSEGEIAKAILAAQDTSLRMKELARKEAEVIIDDAKKNASAIVHESLMEAQKYEQEAAILKKNISIYKNRIESLLKTQLEIVDDIDKIEL